MRKLPLYPILLGLCLFGIAQFGLASTADAVSCRWKINFVKYQVTRIGGENKAEVVVIVSVTGDSVRHPKRGFKRVSRGDTVQVGEELKRVTVDGRQVFQVGFQAREIDASGPSGSLKNESVALSCDRSTDSGKNRTKIYTLGSAALVVKITVAYSRV